MWCVRTFCRNLHEGARIDLKRYHAHRDDKVYGSHVRGPWLHGTRIHGAGGDTPRNRRIRLIRQNDSFEPLNVAYGAAANAESIGSHERGADDQLKSDNE